METFLNLIFTLLSLELCKCLAFQLPQCKIEQSGSAVLCAKKDSYSRVDYPQPSPCNISLIVVINDIKSIDEELQVINFYLTLVTKWTDNRVFLNYDAENKPSNYPFHLVLNDEFGSIWKPRIQFLNSIEVTLEDEDTKEIWYQDPSIFYWTQTFSISLSCKMRFAEFPFDAHECTLKLVNVIGVSDYILLEEPEIFFNDSEKYIYEGNPERLKFDVKINPRPSSVNYYKSSILAGNRSQANIHVQLIRKHKAIFVLISEFYLPTFTYSILALTSYFISVETVPGRMGLLLTLYLIAINNYVSTDVPSTRGISYMDIWFIGCIVPIIFAIIEYGILLAVLKYGNGFVLGHRVNILMVDKVAFIVSLIYISIFDTFYWVTSLNELQECT